MKKCAFLSMPGPLPAHCDDPIAESVLRENGWTVDVVPWQEKDHNWSQYDIVVVRSTWDYFESRDQFLTNLKAIEKQTRLMNPAELVQWNVEKTYLKEMGEKGLSTVPTLWMDQFDEVLVSGSFDEFQSEKIVIKPTLSAGAKSTYLLTKEQFQRQAKSLAEEFLNRPAMAQPFLPSIQTEGEFSLFFFGENYSHTVVKKPKPGDFRVQEEHGGQTLKVEPEPSMKELAGDIVKKIPYQTLYARVDLVKWKNDWALIELELIEPSLYFRCDDQSATRFAEELDRFVSQNNTVEC